MRLFHVVFVILFFASRLVYSQYIDYSDSDLVLSIPVRDSTVQRSFHEIDVVNNDSLRINAVLSMNSDFEETIIFFHGNGDNLWREGLLEKLELIAYQDYNLLAIDYAGYGKSRGVRDIASLYQFANSAYNYVVQNFPNQKLIVWGQSLGTISALHLASRYKLELLICEGTITTLPDLQEGLEAAFSSKERKVRLNISPVREFDNYELAKEVKCPTVFLHGEKDRLAKVQYARRLFDLIPTGDKRFLMLKGAGHNYPIKTVRRYLSEILD